MSKHAWVTLATNDSYSLGALVVAHSLKRVHTEHQLAVLITPGVSEAMKTKLRSVFNVVEEVNLFDSKDDSNLALLKRPELGITFTKMHCWRLTQFEKCVFLDADTLVLRNCDELFEREELSAAPDIGWPDCFNSGVYVFRPNLDTFASLLQFAVTNGSFDGGDQGLLNAYFSDWAHTDIKKHLPFIYNTTSVATYSYLPAFKQFGQNTKIFHFIGIAKPWLQNFNSETRKVYVPSEWQHLANFLQYWWDIFAEDVHARLSPEMQQVFNPWIKPSEKVVSAYHQYRSSTGTIYGSYQTNDDNNEYKHCWQELPHHQQQQQRQREDFIPSYEPTTAHFVDPWEAYLQRQEQEELTRRKHEEERLYYQYLNDLRMQERNNHVECEHLPANQTNLLHNQHLAQHDFHLHQSTDQHDHDHVSHHHDENAFQHTDQWIDKMTRYHQASDDGHWESTADQVTDLGRQDSASFHASGDAAAGGHQPSSRIVEQEKKTIDGDTGHNNLVMHDTKPQMCPIIAQQEPTHSADGHCVIGKTEVVDDDNRMGEASGIAGALAQLHLGEAKSKEQEAYEEHMRRQCWETGNIDYMGRDSFENIWKRIQQTLSVAGSQVDEKDNEALQNTSQDSKVSTTTPRSSRRSSRSPSASRKRDPKDRSPTPQPEEKLPIPDKKEVHGVRPPPVIAEEDDDANLIVSAIISTSSLAMRRQMKLPSTNHQLGSLNIATPLTKQVFTDYQQLTTTSASTDGKRTISTHTNVDSFSVESVQTKSNDRRRPLLIAQEKPSSEDADPHMTTTTRPGQDVPDCSKVPKDGVSSSTALPKQSGSGPAAQLTPRQETKPAESTLPGKGGDKVDLPSKSTSPPTPPQQHQQVAQESLAGKPINTIDSKQPAKTLRKKRHISPPGLVVQQPSTAASTGVAATNSSTPSSSSSLPNAASHRVSSLHHETMVSPATTILSPVIAASSHISLPSEKANQTNQIQATPSDTQYHSLDMQSKSTTSGRQLPSRQSHPSPSVVRRQSPISPPVVPSELHSRVGSKSNQFAEASSSVLVAPCYGEPALEHVSPPVPPRRKRVSKTAKFARLIRTFCTIL